MAKPIDELLHDAGYIIPSYTHYGGVSGLQNLGPLGVKLKNNILSIWREMFLDNYVDEIETPRLTPRKVLKASGHVDRFSDYVCILNDGTKHRVDHLLKLNQDKTGTTEPEIDAMTPDQQRQLLIDFKIVDPVTTEFKEENLMFQVDEDMYLRPELAQGIFMSYKDVLRSRKNKLPFGVSQIGQSYRKEISPKPFTRLREFTQAEIEFFFDPKDKTHPDYDLISDTQVSLFPHPYDKTYKITIQEALDKKIIPDKIIGYYLAMINIFALKIGLKQDKIRFREHSSNEMSHYASCCWDLETLVSEDSWLECVGCADRGDYDLSVHNFDKSMTMKVLLETPIKTSILKPIFDKKEFAKIYTKKFPEILEKINSLSQNQLETVKELFEKNYVYSFDINYESHVIKPETMKIVSVEQEIKYREFVPHVIEPSFGIDRLLFSVLQQSYWIRKDTRPVLSLNSVVSPWSLGVYQLSNEPRLMEKTKSIINGLRHDIRVYYDFSSTSIGKRYVRSDEIGILHIITVDFQTLEDDTVTVRSRDSMEQQRVDVSKILEYIKN